MNILFLTTHLNVGGISSYLLTLTAGLKKQGHHVYIASSGGDLESEFSSGGIEHIRLPIRTKSEIDLFKIIPSLIKLIPLIKIKKIQVIHAHTRVTTVLAFVLSVYGGIPYITTCHGFFKRHLGRRLLPLWGRKVIAISASVKRHLRQDFGVKEDRIRLIYNGIDLNRFNCRLPITSYQSKKKFGLADTPVVGSVGRLSDVKGYSYLIEAMGRVIEDMPQAQLLIVGEGREKNRLLNIVKKINIGGNVSFIASVKDIYCALAAMDLFVAPSLREGLGLSLMEAMACGKCVIASDVGGMRDLIKDGVNGRLFKPADTPGLACVILELLKNREKARVYADNASQFIRENFSDKKMVVQTEEVYRECLR
jgi:glycosyltransferase involved in cell wall biosynthesis